MHSPVGWLREIDWLPMPDLNFWYQGVILHIFRKGYRKEGRTWILSAIVPWERHQIEILYWIRLRRHCWSKILQWVVKALKGKGLIQICDLQYCIWASAVYHIWLQRNHREFNCLIKYEASRIEAIKWDVKSRVDCCRRFKYFAEQNPLQSLGYLLLSVNWWKEELLVRSLGSWLDHGKLFCLLFEFLCCSLSSWFSLIFAEFRRRLLCLIRFAHYYYYNHYYYYY